MKKYYKDMDVVRGIGIFLVVLGHSFPDAQFNNNALYSYIFKFIYSFHMPLFFIISGFFAFKIYKITNLTKYGSFIYNKFRRLMIPYFIVSLISVPIKLYMNRYAVRPLDLNSLITSILFYPLDIPIQYFWFIYTLFFIFVFSPLLTKIPIKLVLLITLVLNILPIKQISIFYAYGIVHYMFYFFLGIYFNTVYEKYREFKYKKSVMLISLVTLVVLNLFTVTKQVYPYYNLVTALTGSILCVNISFLIVNNKVGEMFKFIGSYSYDIYLLSWYFQTGARVVLFQMLKLDYTFVTIIMLLIGFIPIVVSKLFINKIPILNKLLLGK